jgi:hypothetical protein
LATAPPLDVISKYFVFGDLTTCFAHEYRWLVLQDFEVRYWPCARYMDGGEERLKDMAEADPDRRASAAQMLGNFLAAKTQAHPAVSLNPQLR